MFIMAASDDPAGPIIYGVAIVAFYFLPSIFAWNKRSVAAIFVLNLLLGWTVIGWLIALIWGLTVDSPAPSPAPAPLAVSGPPVFCPHCGKYSEAAARFCVSCGAAVA